MNFNKVDVVIPYYNASNTIYDTLKSVQEQTYKEFHCTIVDDKSKDDEFEFLNHCVDELDDDRFTIIRLETNSGLGVARNRGVKHFNSEYVCFLDSDDLYYPDKIKRQLEFIESNNADMVFGQTVRRHITDGKTTDEIKNYEWAINLLKEDQILFTMRCFIDTVSTFIKRDVFLKVEGFEPWYYGEDKFLYFKIAINNFKIAYSHGIITGIYTIRKNDSLSNIGNKINTLDIKKIFLYNFMIN